MGKQSNRHASRWPCQQSAVDFSGYLLEKRLVVLRRSTTCPVFRQPMRHRFMLGGDFKVRYISQIRSCGPLASSPEDPAPVNDSTDDLHCGCLPASFVFGYNPRYRKYVQCSPAIHPVSDIVHSQDVKPVMFPNIHLYESVALLQYRRQVINIPLIGMDLAFANI